MADENRIKSFKNKGKDTEVSFIFVQVSNDFNLFDLGNAEKTYRSVG